MDELHSFLTKIELEEVQKRIDLEYETEIMQKETGIGEEFDFEQFNSNSSSVRHSILEDIMESLGSDIELKQKVETPVVLWNENFAKGFRVDLGQVEEDTLPKYHLTLLEDRFATKFYPERLFNFIGNIEAAGDKQPEKYYVISVIQNPISENTYKALITNCKGWSEFKFELPTMEDTPFSRSTLRRTLTPPFPLSRPSVSQRMSKYFEKKFHGHRFYEVRDIRINEDILNIERKHPQDNRRCFKIAIVYCQPNQTSPHQMFQNANESESFKEFLNILGKKISLNRWVRYKGDMGSDGDSYFTKFKDTEIMFHVSTIMNAEQHRRLIGNDVAVVIFHDSSSSFNPCHLDEFGTVPQIFSVVRPHKIQGEYRYRMAFLTRKNVKYYGPMLPKFFLFDRENLRDFLLTKLINGYIQALSSPPMNRLFYTPRGATIRDLAQQYPPETEREVKIREQKQISERVQMRESLPPFDVTIQVLRGRNLVSKDTFLTSSDSYVSLSIVEQQFKTDIVKKSLNPEWNASFTFNLAGLDLKYEDMKITVMNYNRFAPHQFMGKLIIPLSEIVNRAKGNDAQISPTWYSLTSKDEFDKDIPYGEIELSFSLSGLLNKLIYSSEDSRRMTFLL